MPMIQPQSYGGVTMRILSPAFFFMIAVLTVQPVIAGELSADNIEIEDPFVRAAPAGIRVSAMFMKIRNMNKGHQHLVKVTSDIAENIELHEQVQTGGMMRMRQVEEIMIKGGGVTVLEPGGLHIMLIGLRGAIEAGQRIEFKLVFSDDSTKTITVPVKPVGAM
ncbi:MAG: copper chaperone PCu(A)C [Gammaproteobacteria bacterium]|nr:MAG: copper chaperone PCu(A)C [Gammaproteobacteria bacterium]